MSKLTSQSPQVNTTAVLDPAVVVDNASLTYTTRSAPEGNRPKSFWNRVRGSSGVVTHRVQALSPLSLVVHNGESVGVIGTNGSGKSTLMQMITGQLPPTSGSVYASSTPVMLGVNAALVRTISGSDNITLGCLAMGMTPEQVELKRPRITELSGLEGSLHLPLKAYSSGMASRLQFAIATSVDPDILIIDEALNTGDAQFRARTAERLDEVRSQAGCVFLVSHSLGTIKQMCTRVIWLDNGELLADGDPEEITALYSRYMKFRASRQHQRARNVRSQARRDYPTISIDWAT